MALKRSESGLWIAPNFGFLRNFGRSKGTTRTVTLPTGERVKVWVDDSRTVKQVEHDESLDGIVRPPPIRTSFTARTPQGRADIRARVEAIRALRALRGPRHEQIRRASS